MIKFSIGRNPDNDFIIDDMTVSGYHAHITFQDDGSIYIEDHSTNGTVINGSLLHKGVAQVNFGDNVLFAGTAPLEWSYLQQYWQQPQQQNQYYGKTTYTTPGQNPYAGAQATPQRPSSPKPQVSFGEAISLAFRNYATFSGRARRSELWWYALFNFLIGLIPGVNLLWALVTFLPTLALSVRRLHDTGRSGWFLLLYLVPLVGPILLLIWYCSDTVPGDNLYGPDPKYN